MGSILERARTDSIASRRGRVQPVRSLRLGDPRNQARPERKRMSTAVTTQTFEQEVLQSEKPVIVDFWAEWCGPCHAVSPVLDKIAEERAGELKLVKINVDEEQELMIRYGVQSIPTIVLFKDGAPAAAVIGAQPKGAIERGLGLVEAAV
ncbi:MAG: thioredoxin [Verrucomicrobiota bacterium]